MRSQMQHTRGFAVATLAFVLLSLPAGCITARSESEVALSPRDFAGSTGPAPRAERRASSSNGPSDRTGPIAAQQGMFDVASAVGSPELSSEPPPASSMPTLVEGTVGNINNKAVYISDFLAPISAELEAKTKELKRVEWIVYAHDLIKKNLNQQIEDELLRAEAIADFTPEEKQGLRAVVESLKQKKVSENYGSQELATQSIRSREGQSLDEFGEVGGSQKSLEEWTREEEVKFLIGYQLNRQIFRRVSISWREIQLAYERAHDKFNPPPTAVFRLLRVSNDNTANLAAVAEALAANKDFAELAESEINEYESETGGVMKVPFKEEFAKHTFFGAPALNEAAQALAPGAWTGPIKLSTSSMWIKLERVEEFSMPIYEAQLAVENELRNRRTFEKRQQYLARLRQRASFTDVDEMTDRLLTVAAERFYPPGTPEPSGNVRPTGPARAPARPGR